MKCGDECESSLSCLLLLNGVQAEMTGEITPNAAFTGSGFTWLESRRPDFERDLSSETL